MSQLRGSQAYTSLEGDTAIAYSIIVSDTSQLKLGCFPPSLTVSEHFLERQASQG